MQFNPLSPEFRLNPYPTYDLLRQHAPIFYWERWQHYFLSRYDDCSALLRDNRLGQGESNEEWAPDSQKDLVRLQKDWVLFKNPPDHTRLRGLVYKAFTPRVVEQMRETIQTITDRLLDTVQDKGEMDLIADLAYPLPVTVISEMLGIPREDQDRFQEWSNALARSLDLTDDSAVYDRASEAAAVFTDYLADLAEQRRRQPQNDLLSALVAVEEEGERLTANELYATSSFLFVAGHETTINLIGNGTLALLRHPDQFALLKGDLGLVKTAVEEFLRYDSPVQMTSRLAHEEIAYKGHIFPRGTQISFLLAAANHDPERFENPHQLDITRQKNQHLSFGNGIHYCLGAPLARLEGEIAFTTLLRRLPNLALATETPAYSDNYLLRGLKCLPLTF
ncbi:MAG: cytochrome P450 [Ardenticatenaceae bacterium]|nr:cytochrome P450 [Ardenticatenaceae bacterium]